MSGSANAIAQTPKQQADLYAKVRLCRRVTVCSQATLCLTSRQLGRFCPLQMPTCHHAMQAYEEAVLKVCGSTPVDLSRIPTLFTAAVAKAGGPLHCSRTVTRVTLAGGVRGGNIHAMQCCCSAASLLACLQELVCT